MPGRKTRNGFGNLRLLIIFLLSLPFITLLTACTTTSPVLRVTEVVRVEVSATPPPPTLTPTVTKTPTPTPSPTSTAPAVEIAGNLRSQTYADPTPAPGAYCGYVDTLDFPLNPPDGIGIRGGQDFGVFRNRYGKYHAGEDWGFRGGGAFGEPVYAIGHGTVTYADGLGWGPDKGVVIIRHYLPDGSTFLSFYGHLDPPSVILVPGTCIERGDQVGNIGRPRTSPHLHFEIRTTLPFVPGPGYWEADPTTAGWLPPSATISRFRMEKIPGMIWVRTDIESDQVLGLIQPETLVVQDGNQLIGLYTPAGGLRWLHELGVNPARAVASLEDGRIYVLYLNGVLEALRLPEPGEFLEEGKSLVEDWTIQVESPIQTEMIVSPWGGLVLVTDGEILSLDANGALGWREDMRSVLIGWDMSDETLVFSPAGDIRGLLAFGESGLLWRREAAEGLPVISEDGVYLLTKSALGFVDQTTAGYRVIQQLPEGVRFGEIIAVPGGGVIVLHADRADERLIFFKDGRMIWQKSVSGQLPRGSVLFTADEKQYLLVSELDGNTETIALLRIDIESGLLTRVFEGGTREPSPSQSAYSVLGTGEIVLRFGENSLVVFKEPAD